MDEKYILDLYNTVVKNDPSFKVDVSLDLFRQKMSDQNYAKKIYGWVSGVDQEFKNNNPEDQFMKLLSGEMAGTPIDREIKKKDNTASSLEDGLLAYRRFNPTTGKIEGEGPETESVQVVEQEGPAQQPRDLNTGEYILNSMNAVSRGFYKNLIGNPIKGLGTLLEKGNPSRLFGDSGKSPISDSLIEFGTWFNNAIDEVAEQDEEFKGTLVDQGSQAMGQVLSTVLTAGLGGMASKTLGGASAIPTLQTAATTGAAAEVAKDVATGIVSLPGISSALTVGQSEFERAKEAGATDDQAFEAFYKNAGTGSVLERVPVMQFLKRFNKATQGGVVDYLVAKGKAGVTGGLEEFSTEILQQIYANKTAQEIYNVNQDLFEGVAESGGVGFGVGFLLNALGANARILRKNGKVAEANTIEQQISEFEKRAEKGGKSTYKVNGFSITDPKIINDMIDKLSGVDLSNSNIEIINDPELNTKLQNKIVDDSLKDQIRKANPDLNNASVNAIAGLQKELNNLEGNTTQVAKDRAAEIRTKIKDIQANQLTEEPTTYRVDGKDVSVDYIDELIKTKSKEELLAMNIEINNDQTGLAERLQAAGGTKAAAPTAETPTSLTEELAQSIAEKRKARITELEDLLDSDFAITQETGKGNLSFDERREIKQELQKLNAEQDAIQEQAAGQVPVQSGTGVSQEVAEGTPQAEPQGVTQEGLQEEIDKINQEREKELKSFSGPLTQPYFIFETDGPTVEEYINKKYDDKINELTSKSSTQEVKPRILTESLGSGVVKYSSVDENGNEIGSATVSVVDDKVIVDDIFVQEESKRKGVATSIFDKITEDYKGKSFDYVDANNREFSKPYQLEFGTVVSDEGSAFVESVKEKTEKFNADQKGARDATEFSFDNLSRQPLKVLEDKLEEINNSFPADPDVDKAQTDALAEQRKAVKDEIEKAKAQINTAIESAKSNLGNRLQGDDLDNAIDLIDELSDNKAEIDEDGMVTVYHRTTPDKKAEIEKTGNMKGLEDGVFFSTKETGQAEGYGDAIVKLKIPVEQLILDDTFGDEAHVRIPTKKAGEVVKVKDYIQAEQKGKLEEVGQGLNETDLPGYDKMMNAINDIIYRASNRADSTPETVMDGVIKYLQTRSQAYINATDVQREQIIRDVRKRFGKREKKAPTADKIVGKTKKKEVTADEMAALKDQIKLEEKAAREAKKDINTKRKMIADAINKMAEGGKVTAKKAEAMLKRLSKLNVDSPAMVNKFIDYVFNVFQDADYASKLSTAKSLRSKINKISKNKDKLANLRDLGSKFINIDPTMLNADELAEYNSIADKVLKSIQGSTLKGKGKLAEIVVESDVNKYIDDVVKKQNQQRLDDAVSEMSELIGVELTEAEYIQLMESQNVEEALDKKYDKAKIRSSIQKAFDLYSTMIKESIKTGKDLFNGDAVNYSAIQKRILNQFINMDLNYLNDKVLLESVDALMNFMNNGSIAKMDSILSKYNGEKNMVEALNDGVKSRPLQKFWSKGLGKVLVEQTANINIVFERIFGGFTKGQKMEEAMGVADLVNGKAKGQKESENIVNEYVSKFFDKKPNNKLFNEASNNIERGMGAFMSRNVNGTDAEIKTEFERRKKLISDSITELEKGNEQEVEKAKIYQEIYDKILADSNTIEDVQSKMDKTNLEAVEFWQDKWRDKYEQLYDVALSVYNKVLDKDTGYTTDRFSKLSSDKDKKSDLLNEDMAFIVNSGNSSIYKKETGVLMTATKPKKLPSNEKGKTNRYVDLSFDSNNANSMYDALVDINTAAAIRQIDAAMESDAFSKIMDNQRDKTLIQNRIRLYVANIRNKNPFSNDELSRFGKRLNRVAAISVGQSLGGVTQPIKQTIPIAINTLINAGSLDVKSIFDKSKQSFINRSGRAIANRGIESQAQVSTLNKMVDDIAKSKGEKMFKAIEKVNDWWLRNLLVKFDVGIARASWMTYYEQSLKKQGINPSTIDWNTHEVNEKAANYAQRQVDRQQNVSDSDMAGELLSSKDAKTQIFVKMLMPFASFRMNQSARLGSDMSVLLNWKESDSQDLKIAARSVAGFAAEMATFRILSAGISILLYDAVRAIVGGDEDEEKRQKKIDAIIKGQLTSTVSDVLSPSPLVDPLVQGGTAFTLDNLQNALDIEDEDRVSIYGSNPKDLLQSYGTLGMGADRALQLVEMGQLIAGQGFKDNFNRTKYVSERYRDALELLFVPAIMSNIGLAPAEVNSIVRSTISEAKRNSSTVEGGKTKQDEAIEKFDEINKEADKSKQEQEDRKELKALEELKASEYDSDVINAVNDRIRAIRNPDDKDLEEKKKKKKEEKEKLLGEYDNMTEMERYDPELFEERFGENSEYYMKNRGEVEAEKKLNKLLKQMEDEERGYSSRKKRR
jgi:hypothetical protein